MKTFNKTYLTVALAISTCGVLFQNCAAAPPPDVSQLSKTTLTSVGGASCSLAGAVIQHGQSVTAYSTTAVPAGSTCSPSSMVRTCNDGTLSGSNAYQFLTCSPLSAVGTASCSLDGRTIAHGGSITAYSTTAVAYNLSCSSYALVRVCTNGTLSGNAAYAFATCNPLPAPTPAPTPTPTPVPTASSCTLDGVTLASGQSAYFWTSRSSLYCNNKTLRTCSNGVLSGSTTYQYSDCTPTNVDRCGNTLNDGVSTLKTFSEAISTDVCP